MSDVEYSSCCEPEMSAWRLLVGGRVQGVGFRPFVYRIAQRFGLKGWMKNRLGQVEILAQGMPFALEGFADALLREAPPFSRPEMLDSVAGEPLQALQEFSILPSEETGDADIHVPPDHFACEDCLVEIRDPHDRRYRYPFVNCTQCGPRYTLLKKLPYDRGNTAMAGFGLCPGCRAEYENPLNRRFRAEPTACPACGPKLEFHAGEIMKSGTAALSACVAVLKEGGIAAIKGVGGYHLMCDASSDKAVLRLRQSKPRPHKPLAVMFPTSGADGLDALRNGTAPTPQEAELLSGPMRPIVLVEKSPSKLSGHVAPGLCEIGAMLPSSPLHHLLLEEFGAPLVATSANVGGEPVLTSESEAESRLCHVAEAFLHHDRPILRPAEDPVFRVIAGRPRPLRLGRGCAPLELKLPFELDRPHLALGGHMKNTVALAWGDRVAISPHVGDLGTPRGMEVFEQTVEGLQALYGVRAGILLCDAHPAYAGTRWAERSALPVVRILHHHAHASALAGEYPDVDNWLMFAWDGMGYGEDGTLWGGEAFVGRPGNWRRAAAMRSFRLPGGERASREPWRSAAALCWEEGIKWKNLPEAALLHRAWQSGLNCPQTTSVGRLFDAAAALVGLLTHASFEGHGPMLLEAQSPRRGEAVALPLRRNAGDIWESDWAPLLEPLFDENASIARRAGMFHASLAGALLDQALKLREEEGIDTVGLCGGVFQNRILSESAMELLQGQGFEVRLGDRVACNDAGLSYGQVVEAGSGQ